MFARYICLINPYTLVVALSPEIWFFCCFNVSKSKQFLAQLHSCQFLIRAWEGFRAQNSFRAEHPNYSQPFCPCSSPAQQSSWGADKSHDAGGSSPAEPWEAPTWHRASSQPEVRTAEVGYFCTMLHSGGHWQSQSFRLRCCRPSPAVDF